MIARRALAAILPALLAAVCLALPAGAAGAGEWRSQQPAGGGSHPLLGEVGDIECWSANRCVLIAAGNGGLEPGIFAYDGAGWYRYSTVCGGHEGRIAWVGPTEFWTVSDQQVGQTVIGSERERFAVSLCHFKDGAVVASYGEPLQAASSYRKMTGAACSPTSGECWFGGERLAETTSVNPGAFHLRWDGSAMTPLPSATQPMELEDPGRTVSDLAFADGSFYEGVDAEPGDVASLLEDEAGATSLLHRVDPANALPFEPLFPESPLLAPDPTLLDGALLAGGPGEDLWAVAGAELGQEAGAVVLRLGAAGLGQLALQDPEGVLGNGIGVAGVAAEPGSERVWVALRRPGEGVAPLTNPSRLVRIDAEGQVGPETILPSASDPVGGRKGVAGPIECSGTEQCWLATSRGWLFHLGDDPAPQSDPALHTLITVRPPDNSLPALPPLELPEDDSGLEEETAVEEEEPLQVEEEIKRRPALVSRITQRLIGTTLELKFTLSDRARVWIVAKRAGRVVAKTRKQQLSKGRRSIRVRLDPDRWPTKLDLKAKKVGKGRS